MTNIAAIFQKQIKDTMKNKMILIQFLMFPIMTVIMENSVKIEGIPEHYFANMFAAMYIGMAPIVSMSSAISEEKEKNTLRMLMMSGVSPAEYLVGTGGYVLLACLPGAFVIGVAGGYRGRVLFTFLAIMVIGILTAMLIGAAIGTASRNQMMSGSLTVVIMMIFSFLPMLSMFNDPIRKAAKFTYSQQVSILIDQAENISVGYENVSVILANILIAGIAFGYSYKKCGLA
ncbi:MAG: ABC transporter permease [Lachnospiraceae bacterium]|nr:ABC transporter permease [Lachnospiraceae bacterium]